MGVYGTGSLASVKKMPYKAAHKINKEYHAGKKKASRTAKKGKKKWVKV